MQTVAACSFDPASDGVDHINLYSRGRTPLGRLLSNFAHTPFDLPEHGPFASVEGYWYWLQCEPASRRERLRALHGFAAKKAGRTLRIQDRRRTDDLEFRRAIARALREKTRQTPGLAGMLGASTLPLAHYYVFQGSVVTPAGNEWILEALDFFRGKLRRGGGDHTP
jgi:hypothetical protein